METALYTLAGGVLLGGLGFAGGFFGPILFNPQANQGPLLGIFITGPLGVFLGLFLGGLYGSRRRLPTQKTPDKRADEQ